MKRQPQNIEEILKNYFPAPTAEQTEAAGERVFERLTSAPVGTSKAMVSESEAETIRPAWTVRGAMTGAASAAAAAILILAFFITPAFRDNNVLKSFDALAVVEGAGEPIKSGQIVRSNERESMVLALMDGSRIEMRAQSAIALERGDDGIRIRLNAGSVIVNAVEQRTGHLYVQTKDCTVSVVGTVFVVEAVEAGSRVAVIQGEVRVQQGANVTTLLRGEQVATAPALPVVPVIEKISWSRHIEAHLALLEQLPRVSVVAPPSSAPSPLPQSTQSRPEFEAASVKLNQSGDLNTTRAIASPGGTYMATNQSVKVLVRQAFTLSNRQIEGGPDWIDDWSRDKYDIFARAAGPASRAEVMLMLQALLEDRFKLKFHWETREVPVYALVVAKQGKLGPNLHEAAGDSRRYPLQGVGRMEGKNATMTDLAAALSGGPDGFNGRVVQDKTGLTGNYDFKLEWLPEGRGAVPGRIYVGGPPADGPALLTALEEQLGLKLESQRGSMQVMVIDSVERPAEN
jgi:uncharacterized protein (TIGR03435 family)